LRELVEYHVDLGEGPGRANVGHKAVTVIHARVEDRIKEAKECGLSNFPCSNFQANRVWLLLVQMAQAVVSPR
jgi:hypothetical protein